MGIFRNILNKKTAQMPTTDVSAELRSIQDTLDILRLQGMNPGPYSQGVAINEDRALAMSAYWRCVRLLSDTFASLPFHVYTTTDNGVEVVRDHEITRLLRGRPALGMNAYNWRALAMAQLLNHGNFIGWIERQRGIPVSIRPVFSKVEVEEIDGQLFYIFEYDNVAQVVPERDIFHLKGYSKDGLMGMSVLKAHKESLGIGVGAMRASKQFYDNGAKLDGYLSTDQALKPDTAKRVEQSFKENVNGGTRVPMLDAGVKFYQVNLNPQDAQYIETRKFTELDIARIFGVPPHMLGIMDRATWNNVESLGIEFGKYTMLPYCTNWEQEIDMKLMKPSQRSTHFSKFNMEGLMRADMKTRYESYQLGISYGIMSINEVRQLENRNPVEGGDKHYVQGNNMVDINSPQQDGQE
jgi:HK97 family phage portal protein